MLQRPLYQALACKLAAIANCAESGNLEWLDKHIEAALALTKEHMPSGGGFDAGTHLDMDRSTPDKLVFTTSFHHMNDVGFYDGWTEHTVTVRADLQGGFKLSISGRDRNQIKEYIYDVFYDALRTQVEG